MTVIISLGVDCVKCFDLNKIYQSSSDKIEIHTLNNNFDKVIREIFNLNKHS